MKTINMVQSVRAGLVGLFIFSLFWSMAWASGHDRTFVLDPTPKHPKATGTAVIADDHINVQARGLKPEAVYTVWFVNLKPRKNETGAGTAPFMFRTDAWGNGSYSAPLGEAPFGRWSMIMVVQHPNGDPEDMQHMVGALKAAL